MNIPVFGIDVNDAQAVIEAIKVPRYEIDKHARQREKPHSFTDVLLAGLAPDGGLYVPQEYPHLSLDDMRALKGAPYTEVAFAVQRKLVDGAIPDNELKPLIDAACARRNF